jgi:hypothetical protein
LRRNALQLTANALVGDVCVTDAAVERRLPGACQLGHSERDRDGAGVGSLNAAFRQLVSLVPAIQPSDLTRILPKADAGCDIVNVIADMARHMVLVTREALGACCGVFKREEVGKQQILDLMCFGVKLHPLESSQFLRSY